MRVKSLVLAAALATSLGWVETAQAVTCTPTGYIRDSINLTAALINPGGVEYDDVDATGCNIAIYYGPGSYGYVYGANVHGANYFGILNNGGDVDVLYSTISDIGEHPLNGTQHGVAVYFAFGALSKGKVYGNTVWTYQKGGIVVNGTAETVLITYNTIIGQGPVSYIAQNAIQVGYGAMARVYGNFISGNSYTGFGQTASGGILIVGGDCYGGAVTRKVKVESNKIVGNDVGVWLSNLDAGCLPTATLTRNSVEKNDITNNLVSNTTGNGGSQGYQAGISDQGNGDVISKNDVCGLGYVGPITPTAAIYNIDVTFTNNPVLKKNTICRGPDPTPTDLSYVKAEAYQ